MTTDCQSINADLADVSTIANVTGSIELNCVKRARIPRCFINAAPRVIAYALNLSESEPERIRAIVSATDCSALAKKCLWLRLKCLKTGECRNAETN